MDALNLQAIQQQLPAINTTINLTKRALRRTARQITATSD